MPALIGGRVPALFSSFRGERASFAATLAGLVTARGHLLEVVLCGENLPRWAYQLDYLSPPPSAEEGLDGRPLHYAVLAQGDTVLQDSTREDEHHVIYHALW